VPFTQGPVVFERVAGFPSAPGIEEAARKLWAFLDAGFWACGINHDRTGGALPHDAG